MCGICGIYYYDRQRKVQPKLVEQMNYVQRHRGPDDSGVWVNENVGLGQARLAIIDLSPLGHQPMCNEDGTVWLTFNGEIYNFPELRARLLAKGHQFRSLTDSETILHLWEEKGPEMLRDLRGMFAIALWDDRQKVLFLARDRMGKKPLFYADLPDRLIFGSEIKAILQEPEFAIQPDFEAIHYYLTYQSVPSPYCAFKGIKKLPPAHYLIAKDGNLQVKKYWQLRYDNQFRVETEKDRENLEVEIIERLREAVKIRLISDVPLGAFLSGGIDSSIVVALMAGLINQPVKTFSIGFNTDEYNELPYARMVAERYQTDHHEFVVTPDAQQIFPELVWHYNEPFADSSAIPTYYVSKMARQIVTVVLTGDAGDENFAGYPRYQFIGEYKPDYGPRYPTLLERLFLPRRDPRLRPFASRESTSWRDIQRLKNLTRERLFYYYRITHFHEGIQPHLYTPDFLKKIDNKFGVDIMLEKYRQSRTRDFLDSTLYVDLNLYLPETLMTKTDIAGMTHSLEARMPFLDHKFLEFVARVPSNLKLKDGTFSKYILKKAVEPYLPHEVIYRQKMGFAVPLDRWFRNELKELAYDTLLSKRALNRGYFQRDYIQMALDRHMAGETWQYLIWNLLMLEFWHLMFIDQTLASPGLEKYPSVERRVG
jgi:asparagine synthase (glutamine-hydrolysing)